MKIIIEEAIALVAIGLFVATVMVWAAISVHQERSQSFNQRWEPLLQTKQEK